MQSHGELWSSVVLPAVTWLYGWVDWQIAAKHELPTIVEREHRAAFAAATEEVTEAMRSQPDRLAACIWRALVALLTHFVSRVEPLKKSSDAIERENATLKLEIAELKAQMDARSEDEQMAEGEAGPRKSSLTRQPSPGVERRKSNERKVTLLESEDHIEVSGESRRMSSDGEPAPPNRRKGSYYPGAEFRGPDEDELHEQLVEARRELLAERRAKEAAQQEVEELRAAPPEPSAVPTTTADAPQQASTIATVQPTRRTSKERASSEKESDDEDRSSPSSQERLGRSGSSGSVKFKIDDEARSPERLAPPSGRALKRRDTIGTIEAEMLARVEEELSNEKARRLFLERLRVQLAGALGEGYVRAVEEQLRSRGAGSDGDADAQLLALTVNLGHLGPKLAPGTDAGTQFEESDASLARALDEEEGEEEESVPASPITPKRQSIRMSLKSKKSTAAAMLNVRTLNWTIQAIYNDKLKRDAVDELDHRPKQPLSTFVPDFFVHRHGLPNVASKALNGFREGVIIAANGGNRRAYVLSVLAGYMHFELDTMAAMAEPASFTFYVELERKAMRAGGFDSDRGDGSPAWLPIDRAIELMRNEFRYAKASDTSRFTADVEELLRLPDEVNEITKAHGSASFLPTGPTAKSAPAKGTKAQAEAAAAVLAPAKGTPAKAAEVPVGVDVQLFRRKPAEEQAKILQRREEALVQNKVLRSLNRRGLSLREVFSILDKEGTGEINPDAFIAGIQELEGHLSVVQCTRLMEQIDTDCSGTVDFNELTRALQKLDLRIDITDYLVVCLRFFCSEMKRSADLLRSRFVKAVEAKQEGNAAESSGDDKAPKMNAEGVRALLRSLDAPFPQSTVARLIGEMARLDREAETGEEQRPSKRTSTAHAVERAGSLSSVETKREVSVDAFCRVVMAHGFHAVSSPQFKEMGSAITSVTSALAAAHSFARKLPVSRAAKQKVQQAIIAEVEGDAAAAGPEATGEAQAAAPAAA